MTCLRNSARAENVLMGRMAVSPKSRAAPAGGRVRHPHCFQRDVTRSPTARLPPPKHKTSVPPAEGDTTAPPDPHAGGHPHRPHHCRALRLNEDLTEAIGLGNDLATPPSARGERPSGHLHPDFQHAEQSLRVVDRWKRTAVLNLCGRPHGHLKPHCRRADDTPEATAVRLETASLYQPRCGRRHRAGI
jgi:hypothetical protein